MVGQAQKNDIISKDRNTTEENNWCPVCQNPIGQIILNLKTWENFNSMSHILYTLGRVWFPKAPGDSTLIALLGAAYVTTFTA